MGGCTALSGPEEVASVVDKKKLKIIYAHILYTCYAFLFMWQTL